MSDPDGSPDVNVQDESNKLNEGLKNCRTVLESYRVMLTGQNDADAAEPPEALNDNGI